MRKRTPTDQRSAISDHRSAPDRGHLLTEQRLAAAANLDALSVEQTLRLINQEDAKIAAVVRRAIPHIAPVVYDVVRAFRAGGRLIYLGAGTSGRLGVLDASECPPTFHVEHGMVVGLIAGGDAALRQSSEGKEDDPQGVRQELELLRVGPGDVVVGIAAGGTTPYVLGGLEIARSRGAVTALVCCVRRGSGVGGQESGERSQESGVRNQKSQITNQKWLDHLIGLPVGPEVLTGSTRMKAGTATKLVLNMITTTAMVQLGKAWGNLMVDLRATNAKLRDRAARILIAQCGLSRPAALKLLDRAGGTVKLALVMHRRRLSAPAAQRLLDKHHGRLRPILGAPGQEKVSG